MISMYSPEWYEMPDGPATLMRNHMSESTVRVEHPDPAIQALLQAAFDKVAEQMSCVHEYALRQQHLSPDAYFCRKCGHPFEEAMESLRDCIQIEPRVFTPKRFYRQDG